MKLKIKESKYREVMYLGKVITIPKNHKYVAANEDGEVFSYAEKPTRSTTFWHGDGEAYKKVKGVVMDFEGMWEDWQYSVFYFPLS